ncbi:hypothetical protein EWM64_g5068 [Hericium alpestre]|uniref:Uncharacterized protein n=1 Tax=Hericium alpestre TaxID=135208 RepID=A0A4Y9ZXZ7_9AGAM|nr:hypothetical protein EWM64_g5068 [Hericium alpestre]
MTDYASGVRTPYIDLARRLFEDLREDPAFRGISAKKTYLFCLDIALVALGVRLGFLLDEFTIPNAVDVFLQLLTRLRQNEFLFVIHVYEPSSAQSFFVHVGLLERVVLDFDEEPVDEEEYYHFVLLSNPPVLSPVIPGAVLPLLRSIFEAVTQTPEPSVTIRQEHTQQEIIPLAALLLEYPVAYVPISPEQSIFLPGVQLDVYTCMVGMPGDGDAPHPLLKFSCPTLIGTQHLQLSPPAMRLRLEQRFEPRTLILGAGHVLTVTHHIETHDRVGL